MKKTLYILLLITGFANAQVVNIPDANFKNKLIQLGFDTNSDGNIQVVEVQGITSLDIANSSISDITGIQSFTNMINFDCSNNSIVNIDMGNLTNVLHFNCSNNLLTSLNVANAINLLTLTCSNNQLASVNVSSLSSLISFYCNNNLLTNVNIAGLINLNYCYFVSNNNLTTFNASGCSSLPNSTFDFAGFPSLISVNISNCNALTSLFIQSTQISSLDISGCINLTSVNISNNQLNSLNLNGLINLEILNCSQNQLTNLNLVGLTNLQLAHCYFNQLTALSLSGLVNLQELYCDFNQLTSLDISGLNQLTSLDCGNNFINTIVKSGTYHFGFLNCTYNNLTTLDLSDDTSASGDESYFLGNNPFLEYINVKNGNTKGMNLAELPNLTFICADEEDIYGIQLSATMYGYDNLVSNTYCSFTPGGNYNTITGSITFDADNNGCDASDLPHPNIRIDINDGTNQGATFTNNLGNYNFYTQAGSFALTPNIENPSWFNVSPTTATIPFANNNNNTTTQNFCIAANGVHPDLEIVIAPIVPARPGFDAVYQIVYKNKGNQTLSQLYGVNFFFNQNLMDFVSATTTPSTVGSGSLSWSYANLLPFESRSIYVTLNINTPTDTNPVNIGDILQFTTSILPMAGDESTSDNTFLFNQTVIGSFDPNNITCMEGNVVAPSEIGEYLHYVVNFENTGTAEAENIVVKTEIDTVDFDINSLQMLNTSHNCYTRITGNVVEFIFQNIALDTGGHGNVLLKIRSKSNLVTGDTVSKQANIFFDYNAPIQTNMENTTFQALNNNEFDKDNSISIYPNPTNSIVNINSNNSIKSVQLYDVQGRLLQTKLINETTSSIDISDKSNGIYFLKITSDKGIKVEKIVKE